MPSRGAACCHTHHRTALLAIELAGHLYRHISYGILVMAGHLYRHVELAFRLLVLGDFNVHELEGPRVHNHDKYDDGTVYDHLTDRKVYRRMSCDKVAVPDGPGRTAFANTHLALLHYDSSRSTHQ